LVFRGTNPTEAEDVRDDLNINGIGRRQFDNAKLAIRDWLDLAYQKTKLKPDVIGHSLGGALAQRTAGEFTDKIGKVVTFNSPGIGADNVRDFENRGGRNLKVVHYITAGDPVSFSGEKLLPGIMIKTQGKGGIPLETASNIDLLSAYVGAILSGKNTTNFTSYLIGDAANSLMYNHNEPVIKSTNEKVVISVDDFQYNPKRLALEVARKSLGSLLAPFKISDFLTDESLKLIKQFIRLAAK
jgi:pimeloyl-ACP methyl ester carboxylesterase